MNYMIKFILHGGYTSDSNPLNAKFFAEITKDIPNNSTVLLIYFSRKKEECERLFAQDKAALIKNSEGKRLNYTIALEENFIEQLKGASAIYMRGGETQQLFDTLKKYPNFSEEILGKTVAGSSAGAYVLSKWFYSNSADDIFEGLAILPVKVIAHYNGEEDIVRLLKEKHPQDMEIVILKDFESKVIRK
ncbi:MAG: Type 1 glutamine amidotransferase-like domain-containing protein [bacterium]|nr:Type 1 glutamine amidotransferase-like domain-containing protein [bacterium]